MAKTLKAVDGSNAAKSGKGGTSGIFDGGDSSDASKLGYSVFGSPSAGPAESNSDVKNTGGSAPAPQEGTSLGAYKHQPDSPSAQSGK